MSKAKLIVYVVTLDQEDCCTVHGAFSSRQKAQEFVCDNSDFEIDEWITSSDEVWRGTAENDAFTFWEICACILNSETGPEGTESTE